jgi:hypothetical protein
MEKSRIRDKNPGSATLLGVQAWGGGGGGGVAAPPVIANFAFREFINYAQKAKNSINIVKTLALKHQKNLASR